MDGWVEVEGCGLDGAVAASEVLESSSDEPLVSWAVEEGRKSDAKSVRDLIISPMMSVGGGVDVVGWFSE